MRAHHSYEALDLALRMRFEDAERLLTYGQSPQMQAAGGQPIQASNALHLEAARIVREWVDMFGIAPSIH